MDIIVYHSYHRAASGREYKLDKTSRINFQSAVVVLTLRRKFEQPPPAVLGSPVGSTSIGASTSAILAELGRADVATLNPRTSEAMID
jgi:hypothetical protein